jgi:hypothetical protein
MNEKSLQFVEQLIDKTEKGLILWTPAIEDGQFKTLLGQGELAFVVQVKGSVRKLLLLDEHQETILEEEMNGDEASMQKAIEALKQERGLRSLYNKTPHGEYSLAAKSALLFEKIGYLQELARSKALKVNERLVQAEEILASLR